MRDDREWLLDILEALKKSHPDIPWKGIIGMRNVLIHQYFGLDLDEIWSTVSYDLPALKKKIQELLTEKRFEC